MQLSSWVRAAPIVLLLHEMQAVQHLDENILTTVFLFMIFPLFLALQITRTVRETKVPVWPAIRRPMCTGATVCAS